MLMQILRQPYLYKVCRRMNKVGRAMVTIVGIRFREVGKIFYFDPNNLEMAYGDTVIVETSRGIECGRVVIENREIDEEFIVAPLKPVIKIADKDDILQLEDNKKKEQEALIICKKKIAEHGLDMKLIDVEITFDSSKILFYFTAEGRIDFRDLVKDLAAIFKVRIELRQVGVRDEAKIMGGIGSCGRPLCCHSYLSDFVPVSIKMAKEQNLSLNPQKISGVCGRLMCCLKNESDTYEYLSQGLPNEGEIVSAEDGNSGKVVSVDILKQSIKLLVEVDDEKEILQYHISELKYKKDKE